MNIPRVKMRQGSSIHKDKRGMDNWAIIKQRSIEYINPFLDGRENLANDPKSMICEACWENTCWEAFGTSCYANCSITLFPS